MRVTRQARRLAAANGKWRVYFDHIIDERGNKMPDYLVIASPLTPADHVTGVNVLPIVEGRVVLLRCYRHAIGSTLWEVPRGFIDEGETAVTAALRELAEETGLFCAPADLVPLGHYAPEPGTFAARGALFAAERCAGTLRSAEDEIGHEDLRLFTWHEVAALAASGGIEDAGSLITYYRYVQRLTCSAFSSVRALPKAHTFP